MSAFPSLPPAITLVIPLLALAGCGGDDDSVSGAQPGFTEIAAAQGLLLDVDRATVRDWFMPESMAAGASLFDHDGDGDLDVYLVNGWWDGRADPTQGRNRMFRQEADGRFIDVTEESGLGDGGYGMGVAVADYDGDGDLDVYVTNYGPDALYRNEGEGRFVNVTGASGLGCSEWGASAGWFDADSDGDLDLFVTNYVVYDPEVNRGADNAGRPEYPGPETLRGVADRLYRNDGAAGFTDVSETAGLLARPGKGLGVVFLDLDGDGRDDVYVANDREPNFAWLNRGDCRFEERGLRLGIAHNEMSQPEASMGIAVGDAEGDGRLDLLLTHLVSETHTLYRGEAPARWRDVTFQRGLGAATRNDTGWGTAFVDLDHDGDEDLVCVNGRVLRGEPRPGAVSAFWAPYAERNRLLWNDGSGKFVSAGDEAAPFTTMAECSRGVCVGDVDGDGDQDLLVTTANGTVRLFRNDVPKKGRSLHVRAFLPGGQRDAVGALIRVRAGGREWIRKVTHTIGYLTSVDATVHVGLGPATRVDEIRLRWPDGTREAFGPFEPDTRIEVTMGTGREIR